MKLSDEKQTQQRKDPNLLVNEFIGLYANSEQEVMWFRSALQSYGAWLIEEGALELIPTFLEKKGFEEEEHINYYRAGMRAGIESTTYNMKKLNADL